LEIFLTNNDVLRRIRYTFNFNDKKMVAIFALAGQEVSRESVCDWLKKEDDEDAVNCPDLQLAIFLNGFINEKRGKREGEQPVAEKKLNNNLVLTKLKIALALKAEEVIELLQLADLRISKPELSAFFRKPDHKHYRQCKDQILRNFLQGMQEKYYVERSKKIDFSANKTNADKTEQDDVIIKTQTWRADKAVKSTGAKSSQANKADSSSKQTKVAKSKTVYVNPNAAPVEQTKAKPTRKVLKLKPEDIWKK
jgi:uncharacterized protein YehS (DUF1456 family)